MRALASVLAQVLANRSIRNAQIAWFIGISAMWAYLVTVLVYRHVEHAPE
jgi:hypothetical protein